MFKEMVNSGYFMYMAEASGMDNLISTRTAKINASIIDFKNLIRNHIEINDYVIADVLAKHGLSEDMLTAEEIRKIEREVNGAY